MEVTANAAADVTALRQTLAADAHLTLRLPNNPLTIVRCLRGAHADEDADHSVLDHIDVIDADLDIEIR